MSKLKQIKLVLLDVDGILTNGKKSYDAVGNVLSKQFNDLDFTAIKCFKSLGVNVAFISGDSVCNEAIAKKRNIKFYYTRKQNQMIDKSEFLPDICKYFDCHPKEILFAGDDVFDIGIMQKVLISVCPKNSMNFVKKNCSIVLKNNSGEYLVKEILEVYLLANKIKKLNIQRIYDQELKESVKY